MKGVFIGLCVWLLSSIPASLVVGKLLAGQSKRYFPPVMRSIQPQMPVAYDPVVVAESPRLLRIKN